MDYKITDNGHYICNAEDKLDVRGNATPTIIQSGGVVMAWNNSAPVITQSGGVVWACDDSAPVITQSGGWVVAYDDSKPVITQTGGGWVRVWDNSKPVITQSGGGVRVWDNAKPVITQVKAPPVEEPFNIPIILSPAMHKDLAVAAERYGLTLEDYVGMLLSEKAERHIAPDKVETYKEFLERLRG